MKRVLVILLSLSLLAGILSSCGATGSESHVHTYSDKWTCDSQNHWYDPTCECEDAGIIRLAHADDNNDGACDVCKFTDHTHTYSEDWTADCTNHWNAADCGHIVAGSNVGAHVDGDNDGACDVCKYAIQDLHNHYYDVQWTYDGEYHWHAALCEHGVEVADRAAHNVNAAGYCTVCDAKVNDVDRSDLEAVLLAAIANNHKVVSGDVELIESVYDLNAGGALVLGAGKSNIVHYVLGNDASYIFYESYDASGEFLAGNHQWFQKISDDEIFGVEMITNGRGISPISGAAQHLTGYNYTPGTLLAAGYDDTTTLAITVYSMFDQMSTEENVSDKVVSYNEKTGVYSFSYTYWSVNKSYSGSELIDIAVELFEVDVEFRVDENFVINVAEIDVTTYRNLDIDNDFVYDEDTNTIEFLDTATPTNYHYNIGQISGERVYTTIYPKSSVMPVDFELTYVTSIGYDSAGQQYVKTEEAIDGVLTIKKNTYTRLHLTSLIPYSADASFLDISDFEISYVNNGQDDAGRLWRDEEFTKPSYSGYTDCITFTTFEPGSYTLTVKYGDLVKTVEIVIPEDESSKVPENTADTMYVVTTDTYTWIDEYTFTAPESGKYTFTLPAGLGMAGIDGENPVFDPFAPSADILSTHTVVKELAAGEKFTFAVGAFKKDCVWAIKIAFEACDVENSENGNNVAMTQLSIGNNNIAGEDVTYSYTASVNGKLGITASPAIGSVSVSYTVNGGAPMTIAASSSVEIDLAVGDTVVVTVVATGYATLTVSFTEG